MPSGQVKRVPRDGNPRKPSRRGALWWALYLLIIVGALAFVPRVLAWALDTPYPLATVSGSSMWPALKKGDLVVLEGVDGTQDLRPGDIIAFRHEKGLAIHRVLSIEGDFIVTKGDSNLDRDPSIHIDQVVGKIPTVAGRLVKVPVIGYLSVVMGPLVGPATAVLGNAPEGESDVFERRGMPIEEVEGAPAIVDGYPAGEIIGPARELPGGEGAAPAGTSQGAVPDLSNAEDSAPQEPAGTSQDPVPDLSQREEDAQAPEPAGASQAPVPDLSGQEGGASPETGGTSQPAVPDLSEQESDSSAEAGASPVPAEDLSR